MNIGETIKRIELIYPYVDDITQQALRKAIKALEKNISEPVVQCEDATFECPLCGGKSKTRRQILFMRTKIVLEVFE